MGTLSATKLPSDPALDGPWSAYQTWAATARYHKDSIDNLTRWSLRLAIGGVAVRAYEVVVRRVSHYATDPAISKPPSASALRSNLTASFSGFWIMRVAVSCSPIIELPLCISAS